MGMVLKETRRISKSLGESLRIPENLSSVKANRLRLEDYIQYLLTALPERLATDPKADIDDLLPWSDSIQHLFGTGD